MTSVRNFPLKTSGGPTKNWQTGVRHPDEKKVSPYLARECAPFGRKREREEKLTVFTQNLSKRLL